MQNKVGVIKNPLSVIAIFAGIAEISGTMVLPHIAPGNQTIFIWFLMLFPFTLIILFFITLNWNYKVLYAPSDFKDEDNFVNLQQASTSEVLLKIEDDLIHQENESSATSDESTHNITLNTSLTNLREVVDSLDNKFTHNKISSKEERAQQSEIIKRINHQRIAEARLLEKHLIAKVQKDFSNTIHRDIKIESKNNKLIFDGIIQNGQSLTVFEVQRINLNTFKGSYLSRLMDNYKSFYSGLTELEKHRFSLVFIVATDDTISEIKTQLERLFSTIDFNYETKFYSIDSLTDEKIRKVS